MLYNKCTMQNQRTKQQIPKNKQSKNQEYLIQCKDVVFIRPIPKTQLNEQLIAFCAKKTLRWQDCTQTQKYYLRNLIRQNKLLKLILKKIKKIRLIKQITDIKFPNLISLNLQQNKIANIEFIQQLYCPKLNYLWLRNNLITNVKPLYKVKFYQILLFNLQYNSITHIGNSERIKINKFATLVIKQKIVQEGKIAKIQQQDQSYLAKFESTFFKNQLWTANTPDKIVQRKVCNILYYNDLKKLEKVVP